MKEPGISFLLPVPGFDIFVETNVIMISLFIRKGREITCEQEFWALIPGLSLACPETSWCDQDLRPKIPGLFPVY